MGGRLPFFRRAPRNMPRRCRSVRVAWCRIPCPANLLAAAARWLRRTAFAKPCGCWCLPFCTLHCAWHDGLTCSISPDLIKVYELCLRPAPFPTEHGAGPLLRGSILTEYVYRQRVYPSDAETNKVETRSSNVTLTHTYAMLSRLQGQAAGT